MEWVAATPDGLPLPVSFPTLHKRRRTLYLPLEIETERWRYLLPRGYTCNGGSIPRPLWVKYQPFGESTEPGFWAHDFAYSGRVPGMRRKDADNAMMELFERYGVDRIDRTVIYRAVRLFGGGHWKGKK